MPVKTQQLYAINISADVREALEARVKDPLWFLARQLQSGEFEAESGGRPAEISVTSETFAFTEVRTGKMKRQIDTADPLEALIEAESAEGDSPAWRAEALEYEFDLKARGHDFLAAGYDGRALDWHDFALTKKTRTQEDQSLVSTITMVPNQLTFPGAPDPRWWALEEGDAYFEGPEDPEPNALSMLLPELFFTDINNWYVIPAPMPSGNLRRVTSVKIIDSFNVATELSPIVDARRDTDWALFAIDNADSAKAGLDGSNFMAPNVALEVLENDEVEEVRFIRDEHANLVWAWERQIVDGATGQTIATGTERPVPPPEKEVDHDGLPQFRLMSQTARPWIPYVPRHRAAAQSALDGEITLRRGRTDPTSTKADPQHRSRLVAEASHVMEEQIPSVPLKLRRVHRYARGSDGKQHFWVGRDKDVSSRTGRPNLRFDFLHDD